MLNQSTLRCIIIHPILVVINLDLHIPNYAKAAKLCLKIKAVSDGVKADLNEAIAQAAQQDIKALPSLVTDAAVAVQTTDAFVQGTISFAETWDPILKKLEALQSIGNYLSEVSAFLAFLILDMVRPIA